MMRAFSRDRGGNVGIILALAIVPLVGLAGLAVDYARAANYQSQLQNAADSTALAMARLPAGLSKDEITDRAKKFFDAGMRDVKKSGSEWLTIDPRQTSLRVEVKSNIDTTLLRVINKDTIDVEAVSEIAWGLSKVEVAMVLDTTTSMAGDKIKQLRTAATSFVDILEKVNSNGSVRIGIVPYDVQVRLEESTVSSVDWIDFSSGRNYPAERNEIELYPARNSQWNGCISDRAEPKDVDLVFTTGAKVPAMKCKYSTARIMPLTENFSSLRSRISGLTASGSTNIPLGLAWGMALLDQNSVFKTKAIAPESKLEKAVVLLTDGNNTQNLYRGDGYNNNAQIDARLKLLCAEARKLKYTVYTIRVMDGNASLLRSCAAKKGVQTNDAYFNVEKASELTPVFQQIANELSDLRISK